MQIAHLVGKLMTHLHFLPTRQGNLDLAADNIFGQVFPFGIRGVKFRFPLVCAICGYN